MPEKGQRQPKAKTTKQALRELQEKHNDQAKLIQDVVLPSIQVISQLVQQSNNHSAVLGRATVIINIVEERLGITADDFQEAKAHLHDIAQKNAEQRRLQSEEAGSDEDSGVDGQPGVLDDASGGADVGGAGAEGHGTSSPEASDASDPASGAGQDIHGVEAGHVK